MTSLRKSARNSTLRLIARWTILKLAAAWTSILSSSSTERSVKIVLLAEARRQFIAEDTWWRNNRDARELFADEFSGLLHRLRTTPELGQRYRRVRGKLVQRLLMKRCRCHVYYFFDRSLGMVEIHSIWGSSRRRGPRL
jgi:plasmid stabilization system protein ParE